MTLSHAKIPRCCTSIENGRNSKNLQASSGLSGAPLLLELTPSQNIVNYIFGTVPVLTAPTTTAAVISVTNNGNVDSNGGLTATSDNNNLSITNNCQSTVLYANAANTCTLSFSVSTYTPGSAVVTFKNNNSETIGTQTVVWTNNTPVPAVYLVPNVSNVSFAKRSTESSIVFTVSNVGKAPLNNASYESTNTGPATWVQDGTTCPSSISPNEQCTITGHFVGTNDGTGVLYLRALGSYNSINYSFVSLPLNYEVTAAPSLSVTTTSTGNMSVLANGVNVATRTYTVFNQGSDPAFITKLDLIESPTLTKPSISGGTCHSPMSLAEDESCTVVVSYGPVSSSNTANESGTAVVNIDYHGGTPDLNRNVQDSFNYNLVGNDSSLIVSQPVGTNLPGNGQESDPFKGNPTLEPMKITLTYTNPSVNYGQTNLNFDTNNLPFGVIVDPSSTCPTGANTKTLGIGESCTLVFTLDRDLLTKSPTGGSSILNFTTPTATWTTPLGFYSQPGSMLYMNYLQPTIVFTLSQNGASFESTILSMAASNESTATTLTANVSGVKNWLLNSPTDASSNCTVNSSDYSVSCDLKSTTLGNVTYIMPNYMQSGESADIPLMFSTASGEYAYLNPSYTFINYILSAPGSNN